MVPAIDRVPFLIGIIRIFSLVRPEPSSNFCASPEVQTPKPLRQSLFRRPRCQRPSRCHPNHLLTPLHGISPPRWDLSWIFPPLDSTTITQHMLEPSPTMSPVTALLMTTVMAGRFPPLLPTDTICMSLDTLQAVLSHHRNLLISEAVRLMNPFIG
jgi:hypothetical protein